jgi:hypothetical protein
MATQQSTSNNNKKGSSRSSSKGSGRSASTGSARASEATSERDDTYGLISVIYHSLQGAETCNQYIEDARRAGNDELVSFFEECREEQNRRALLGRQMLATELADMEDEVEAMLDEDSTEA